MLQRISFWMIVWLALHGCILGPTFRKPSPCIPPQWHTSDASFDETQEACLDWWRVFGDPQLDRYIHLAAVRNHDVAAAEANVLAARAMIQSAAAPFFPLISGDANASRTAFSKNGPIFEFQGLQQSADPMPQVQRPLFQNLFNLNFDASWELDLFGKGYRTVEAAGAQWRSAMEARNDLLLSVLGEVARVYIDLRGKQRQWELTKKEVSLLEQRIALVQERLGNGLDNEIEIQRAQAALDDAKANLPDLERAIYQAAFALSVLTGSLPECLLEELLPMDRLPCPPEEIAVGLRSDLLRRRPDVRRAEEDLHAAVANIGVAITNFFPSFSLLGFLGLQSLDLRNLLELRSNTWSYGADLPFPVYQGGGLTANLRISRAQAEQAYQIFQQTVLKALEDVESSLVAYAKVQEVKNLLQQKVSRIEIERDVTRQRLDAGLVDALNLIDFERELVASEKELTNSRVVQLLDMVALYKALGGGWQIPFHCCEQN